ncbi:MAG: hypothetical protein WCK65_15970, partial [Rhodospirillaceae bacterium]
MTERGLTLPKLLSSQIYAEIADNLICWPDRVKKGRVLAKSDDDNPSVGVMDYFGEFVTYFCEKHPKYHKQDVEKACTIFLEHYKNLTEWHTALLFHSEVKVRFSDGEPLIMSDRYSQWQNIIARHDPDCMISFELAKNMGRPARRNARESVSDLKRWSMIARCGDPDLLQLLDAGVSDLHVHLGGTVPVAFVWQQLMMGEIRFEMLRRVSRKISDEELAQMERARKLWNGTRNAKLLAQERIDYPVFFKPESEKPFSLNKVLRPERQMLTGMWYRLLYSLPTTDPIPYLLEIDEYLAAKRLFLSLHQQSYTDRRPGLPYFEAYYFNAAKPARPKSWERERSPRLLNREYAHRLALMLPDDRLQRLELRIAPERSLRGYVDFLNQWQRLEDTLKITKRGIDINFAIHFKRHHIERDKSPAGGVPLTHLRRILDQEAATLHVFRNRRPDLAGKITRIDVCGWERDSNASVFFFHMNLLRGDSVAHKQLAEEDMSFIVEYDRWRGLYNNGMAGSLVALPELGLTFHAGEDFYHPLDGIFQIDSAIEGLHMRAGDSLGHA